MDVQAFYNALAHVIGEKTNTEIKVKEITENVREHDSIIKQGICGPYNKSA